MKYLIGIVRFILFAGLLSVAIILFSLMVPFAPNRQKFGLGFRKFFIHLIQPLLGIKLRTFGDFPQEPGLIVCNHRSYIDPAVVLKHVDAFPVSKAEVRKWPLIGYGAQMTGIIFVDRESKNSRLGTLRKMQETLRKGYSILNYPEGTTHDGDKTLDFKPAAFKMAIENNMPIWPVVLDYKHKSDAWVGDDTFFPHFIRCFGKPYTSIKVSYGPKIEANDFKGAMEEAKRFMDSKILELRAGWQKDA
ncbi:MAG: 1-acyl-sn-glycerol-3-phosphate acyltransferase [Flavobacteriales bacterium]|nr:1-acyl-sn-glycerol-3-phosphate acyltransferase [Flavobacteriales bacterium]